jgi:hypothetical protein
VPQIHQLLRQRGVTIAERRVSVLLHRYAELVARRLADPARLRQRLAGPGGVILALAGLQPEVGHAVVWVLRAVSSGEPLLARRRLGATADDLAPLLEEGHTVLTGERAEDAIPMRGVISDGQVSIRHAVARVLPGVPHQLCQLQSLRAAATPLFAADRHAKKARKKRVRGVRPIERRRAGEDRQRQSQSEAEAQAARGDCLAVRSALTDDGRPPLAASGLKRKGRLEAIADSLARVQHVREAAAPAHGEPGQGG